VRRTVLWEHPAVEDLFELMAKESRQARKVMIAVRSFGMGESSDFRKLSDGSERWRLRTGDWRIFLRLESEFAYIAQVKNRRDAYPG
jgi:mRNA-degrading endonuclease RelE of RelBE toxin-antitoxin system